jgi:hypothetical protein
MKNIVKKGKFFLLLFIATSAFGQSIKKLNDPSIVAQHKRMTYESWNEMSCAWQDGGITGLMKSPGRNIISGMCPRK